MSKEKQSLAQRSNIIRAAVMGANDGILSVSGIVIGVAGATTDSFSIFIAGFAGALAGTVSMAMGEYVSVHSQNDAQKKAEQIQLQCLDNDWQTEFNYVKDKYVSVGIDPVLAQQATKEMMEEDALGTTVRERYGFTLNQEMNAISAGLASMISFPLGSILPMLAITLLPSKNYINILGTGVAVAIALAITGYLAALFSDADLKRATLRNVLAGIFTMIITFLIGTFMGEI